MFIVILFDAFPCPQGPGFPKMEFLLFKKFRGSPDFISSIIPALCLQFLFCLANIFSWNRIPLRNFIVHPTPPPEGAMQTKKRIHAVQAGGSNHRRANHKPCEASQSAQIKPRKWVPMKIIQLDVINGNSCLLFCPICRHLFHSRLETSWSSSITAPKQKDAR